MASTEVEQQQNSDAAVAAEEAYAVETQIKAAMRDGRDALWRLMEALYAFDDMRGWLALGHDNLTQWLADPEVSMTRTTYYRWVKTWGKLHVERNIDGERLRQLDASKASMVVDVIVAGKAPVDEVLSDVEELGARDLREKYLPAKKAQAAKTDQSDSGHKPESVLELTAEDVAEMTDVDLETVVHSEGGYTDESRQFAADEIAARGAKEAEAQAEADAGSEAVSGEILPPEGEDGEFRSIADLAEEQESDTTSPSAQAVVDAEQLPWEELEKAFLTNAPNPRIPRAVLEEFLTWRETHLG